MHSFEGVANTLFVPLVARISISKAFPAYFYDAKALELEPLLPKDASKGASQYSNMASVARYYHMDRLISAFARVHKACNVVCLGAGLETAYDRLHQNLPSVQWYQVDLPDVIALRKEIFGLREQEKLIPGDMFQMAWVEEVDTQLPTLLVVSGVFQYFYPEQVTAFIKACGIAFPASEMIFDATSQSGLAFTNWFIRRTGNTGAQMHFAVDDSSAFARSCNAQLLEERTFFSEALKLLGNRLHPVTRISMLVAEKRKQVKILHLNICK